MKKKIYVIATETQYGYEEDSTTPNFVTEILYHLGAWNNRELAGEKAFKMNTELIPEDDSPYNDDTYYVMEMEIND